jgi:YD repeat-containing protein
VAGCNLARNFIKFGRNAAVGLLLALATFLSAGTLPAAADNAQYFYDPGGRLIGMIDATNGSAKYSYDAAGNITSIARTLSTTMGVVQFFPTRGPAGTSVTISGTSFVGGTTTVKFFNNVTATPSLVTANSITVPVPALAGTGPITISRTSPAGSITTATSFTVASPAAAPTITGFTPGTLVQGSSVTITGTNFDTADSKVFVNGQAALVTGTPTTTSITFTVPQASSGKITVTTPAGSATSTSDFVVPPLTFAAAAVSSSVRTTVGAAPLSAGTGASGTVTQILFDVGAGQGVSFHLNHTGFPGCPKIWLLAANGAILYYNSGSCTPDVWFAANPQQTPGTYSIVLAPTSSAGTFTTTLFDVPADATATAAVNGTTSTLNISTSGQHGVVTFVNNTAGQKVMMNVNSNINMNYFVTIKNPDGTYLMPTTLWGYGNYWVNDAAAFNLTQTGTYRITVEPIFAGGASGGTGPLYTTIFPVPADATGTAAINGTTSTLTLTTPGQHGAVTFVNSTAGQKVTMNLNSNMTTNYYVTIKNPNGTDLMPTTLWGYGNYWVNDAPVTLAQTGTYTITVVPQVVGGINAGTGPLYTTIFPVPADAAQSLTIGGSAMTLTISTPGQRGAFAFSNSTVGQQVKVSLSAYAITTCSAVSVLKPDGTVLMAPTNVCGSYTSGVLTLPQTGAYKVLLVPVLAGAIPAGTGTVAGSVAP